MLDLERDRLRPIVDLAVSCSRPYTGSERAETACGAKGARVRRRHLATRRVRAGARIRGHLPVASDIRVFDTVLSSMRHHQVLCLACMLSVFVCTCCIRHISVATPSKPVVHGSLVKNGLRIVNNNIIVNFACAVIPDVPQ